MYDRGRREYQIEHRRTNGQVERTNRIIKEETVKRFHYDAHDLLERHLTDFIDANNLARRLKLLFLASAKRVHLQKVNIRPGT